jgi:membrane protease YdiL (CAAX protease family)
VTSAAWLGRHLKGHLLLFEGRARQPHDPSAGVRLLLIFVLLEGIIGPRLSLFSLLGVPLPPFWARVPILLALALTLVRFFAGLRLARIGLRREWSTAEKSYFVQVIVLANAVFLLLFAGRLRTILADPSLRRQAYAVVLTYVLWGFYQELVYRGILQTALVQRWGWLPGIVVSNALYTFGPLHFYHFADATTAQALAMFAGIFAIGLFFAAVFHRSGNLWMVGVFHGIGDAYISGLGTLRPLPATAAFIG